MDQNQEIKYQTKLLEKILKNTEKTRHHLAWNRVIGLLKLAIILAPIILGIIYLPPFINKLADKYIPDLKKLERIIDTK